MKKRKTKAVKRKTVKRKTKVVKKKAKISKKKLRKISAGTMGYEGYEYTGNMEQHKGYKGQGKQEDSDE
jgi:hypothetical protein